MLIADLIPASVVSTELDNLRTFCIIETEYDWFTDTLRVTPDRASLRLSTLLPRTLTVEAVI